jgi:hypothetical protein
MVVVKKKKGESNDKLIARFRKKALDAGIVEEARERARHTSKAEERKKRKKEKEHNIKIEKKRNR